MTIKTKQVIGVSLLVGGAALGLSLVYLVSFARLGLAESEAHGTAVSLLVFQRATEVLEAGGDLQQDAALASLLQAVSAYARHVDYAAITDASDIAIVHGLESFQGAKVPREETVSAVLDRGTIEVLRAISDERSLEVRRELPLGDQPAGAVRIGISTVFLRTTLQAALQSIALTVLVSVLVAVALASLLSQWLLRPIHVLRSSLTRLGRGELGVTLDLPPGDEFRELAQSFNTINERLAAAQTVDAGDVRSVLRYSQKLAALGRLYQGLAHEIKNPLNAMTIHLEILKLKLTGEGAGRSGAPRRDAVATESPDGHRHVDVSALMKHAGTIGDEIRRLDEVVQSFLKFARPQEITLGPVSPGVLVTDVLRLVEPDAARHNIAIESRVPADLPSIQGDAGMLSQALLNLALNACQAMPEGGRLAIVGRAADDRVELVIEDSGVGIPPEHLEHIFDLYFTTRKEGKGFGLSLVYRTVQLHDGEIDVQSTVGHGTQFRLTLPTARS